MLCLVTTESLEAGLLPLQQNAQIVERAIISGLEAITKLKAEKKILAGGAVVGARRGVAIIEAASNEELGELLQSLPFLGVMKIDVTPLESMEYRLSLARKNLEQLKAAL